MPTNFELPILVGLFTLIAAIIDLKFRRVPNYVTVPAAALGLIYHSFAPHGQGALFALGGFGVGFVLLLLPWILGGGGMGDVKLLAALGVWLGPLMILLAFAGGAIVAALMATVVMFVNTMHNGIMATRRRYLAVGSHGQVNVEPQNDLERAKKRRVLPFAVPVAISTWALLAWMLLRTMS